MNVLIDIRSLLDKPYTGVAQYTLNFLNEVLERDKENNYFLFYNSAKIRNRNLPIFNYPNVKIIGFHWPNKIFNFCLIFLKWPKIDKLVEKKTGKKIDQIFLPNFNFVAFSRNKKIDLVVHDLSFEIYPHFFTWRQRLWHKLVKPIELCQRASKIITHSENTKNDIIDFYKIDSTQIEVKKPAIARKFFQPIDEKEKIRVKQKYSLPDDFLLYLGNLEPRKNLDTLIRAFAQLLVSVQGGSDDTKNYENKNGERDSLFNIKLVIAGTGRQSKKLKKLAKSLEVGEQVEFLGYVPEEDKQALYHLAELFVYPSFYEGYGYPVAEASACGLPVITSHTSSLTEIGGEDITLINPHDINDLVEAIKATRNLD